MVVSVVAVGNSRGVRIPSNILKEMHITDKAEMRVENDTIVIKPIAHKPREGWREAFEQAGKAEMLIDDSLENAAFDWVWEAK